VVPELETVPEPDEVEAVDGEADDEEPLVDADEADTRCDCATITITTARNSVTANVTTHFRIVRTC
jgi:hypothetical protein